MWRKTSTFSFTIGHKCGYFGVMLKCNVKKDWITRPVGLYDGGQYHIGTNLEGRHWVEEKTFKCSITVNVISWIIHAF